MKKILFVIFFLLSNAHAQEWLGGGIGMGYNGGYPGGNGSLPTFSSSNGSSIPIFESTANGGSYNQIKPNASCPLLTQTVKQDQDALIDLKTYLSSFSRKAECAQNPMAAMSGNMTISTLESMLGNNSSPGVKCYTKNVEQISDRNMAYFYAEKGMDQKFSSPYALCNSTTSSVETVGIVKSKSKIKECIATQYETIIDENAKICEEVAAPQAVQNQINKSMVELERMLVSSLTQSDKCAPEAKDAFKSTMNTFLKVKALSAVGPWGAMAGFGADLIGSLLDKIFPNESQKASALMDDILSEDNFEQNSCLYFTIQQKMYCADQPLFVTLPTGACNNVNVSGDLIKLLQNVKSLKKIAESVDLNSNKFPMIDMMPMNIPSNPNSSNAESKNVDLSKFESGLDDLTKFALASEEDIRVRIKTLPKIQQNKELTKIDSFYKLLNDYQKYDPASDKNGTIGQKILEELQSLVVGKQKINFEELILKTTPGLKVDVLKQREIANSIEQILDKNSTKTSQSDETSRSMAKYNKYKNAMGVMAQNQFESRLNKQFKEFETQIKFVTSKEGGVSSDVVAEGMLRNLIRHCTLLQEIYDPRLEGKIPKQCEKLGCGKNNKLDWFVPRNNQLNLTQYKAKYCDKSISFKRIEDEYVKELNDPKGAKICGQKPEDFF